MHDHACPGMSTTGHACMFFRFFHDLFLMLWIFCSEGTQVPPLSGLSRKLDERPMPFSQLHTFQGVHVCFWLSGLPKKLGTEMPLWPRVSVLENATALKCLCALHATSAFGNPIFFVSMSRPNVAKDDRAHRKFLKAGLALKEVITWHQLPIKNSDDEMEIKSWPLMLPHNLALAPANCLMCSASFSVNIFLISKVTAMIRSGHRDVLGFTSDTYWNNLKEYHGLPKPAGAADALGFNLYGDEGQIFDHVEHLCLNWASETTPLHTSSRYSRFLIGLVPSNMFWKSESNINITLQELLRPVIESFRILETSGCEGLHGRLIACKGDWKFLVQSLHLVPQPSKNEICWACGATKDMRCPFTDMASTASWRSTPPVQPVHHLEPQIFKLAHRPLIALDAMHMWHLGVGRDLAASTLALLLRSNFYDGSKVG